jgi:glucokinase
VSEALADVKEKNFAGIGIGAPGNIDLESGEIRYSPNFGWKDVALGEHVRQAFKVAVFVANDARCATLGEHTYGIGKGVDDFVLLTLGTGIGGGIISDGKMVRGFMGMAGELGHITVVPNGLPCGCGNRGCLEKHASATAISAMARLLGYGDISAKRVYERAVAGDERAREIFISMGEALGIALATLVNAFNAPLYLLSGGVIGAWEFFAPAMLAEARRRSFSFRTTNTRVEKAELGGEAGLYGAAYLPWAK